MSKESVMDAMRQNEQPDEAAQTETSETAETAQTAEAKEPKPKKEKKAAEAACAKEKEELNAKIDELNDKYLRMVAEYDNFRRRAAKEKEASYSDAYGDALCEILPVIDNLERAAAFAAKEPDSQLAAGVQMTLNQFRQALEKMGVEPVGQVGDTFDPNLHNAVMHTEDDTVGENVITQIFQTGYRRGDRVIRYAMVQVAN